MVLSKRFHVSHAGQFGELGVVAHLRMGVEGQVGGIEIDVIFDEKADVFFDLSLLHRRYTNCITLFQSLLRKKKLYVPFQNLSSSNNQMVDNILKPPRLIL